MVDAAELRRFGREGLLAAVRAVGAGLTMVDVTAEECPGENHPDCDG
jgi:hypothetical protein